jgi:saccharopepsin
MFPSSYVQSLLFFAVFSAYASPIAVDVHPAKLGFKCKINTLGSSATLPELDRMRAVSLVQQATQDKRSSGKSITVTNSVVTYTAEVGVGSPSTKCKHYHLYVDFVFEEVVESADKLLIDTGSSNTWIGAGSKKYKPTKSSHKTGDTVVRIWIDNKLVFS